MTIKLVHVELFRLAFEIVGFDDHDKALALAGRMLRSIEGKSPAEVPVEKPPTEKQSLLPVKDPAREFKPVNSRAWTPEMIQDLKRWWAEGLSAAEIGRRIGKTGPAVATKASSMNLPRRKPDLDPLLSRRCPGCQRLFVTRDENQRICPECFDATGQLEEGESDVRTKEKTRTQGATDPLSAGGRPA